uniref:Uncharacterized protein n=1 Tax=Romanomermis culicivorax TaxID=13658 RepID=A0A915KFW7_ROMCU
MINFANEGCGGGWASKKPTPIVFVLEKTGAATLRIYVIFGGKSAKINCFVDFRWNNRVKKDKFSPFQSKKVEEHHYSITCEDYKYVYRRVNVEKRPTYAN